MTKASKIKAIIKTLSGIDSTDLTTAETSILRLAGRGASLASMKSCLRGIHPSDLTTAEENILRILGR